eukprot:TRINITY_DN17227_c0_g1_i8.p1 TRINITY_DN17227_c0_g1~~TRINITY_DN17227_c0_g1_i8.p1  ORF type:complete len:1288 (+),score=376.08 TRINITY_DN17227_c0_g1_i8:97-3960(+)
MATNPFGSYPGAVSQRQGNSGAARRHSVGHEPPAVRTGIALASNIEASSHKSQRRQSDSNLDQNLLAIREQHSGDSQDSPGSLDGHAELADGLVREAADGQAICQRSELPPSPAFGSSEAGDATTMPISPSGNTSLETPSPELGTADEPLPPNFGRLNALEGCQSPSFGQAEVAPPSPSFGHDEEKAELEEPPLSPDEDTEVDSGEEPALTVLGTPVREERRIASNRPRKIEAPDEEEGRSSESSPPTPDFGFMPASPDECLALESLEGKDCEEAPSRSVGDFHDKASRDELLTTRNEPDENFQRSHVQADDQEAEVSKLRERCKELQTELHDREERLDGCYKRLLQVRLQEQGSLQDMLDSDKAELQRLKDEEAMNTTLRLENDDLASEVRSLRGRLVQQRPHHAFAEEEQFAAAEAVAARVARQEAVALGDALERAESETLEEAAAARRSPDASLAELQRTQRELNEARRKLSKFSSELDEANMRAQASASEVTAALAAVADSHHEVEEVVQFEWRAAEAFQDLAGAKSELASAEESSKRHARALAASQAANSELEANLNAKHIALKTQLAIEVAKNEERLARAEHAEVLEDQLAAARAAKTDAEARLAEVEEKALELNKQLDVAHAGSRNSEAQLQLASERHAEELNAQLVQQKVSSKLEERLARAKQAEVLEEQLAAAHAEKRDAEARLAQVEEKALELDKQLDVAHAGRRNSEAQLRLANERHAEELKAQLAQHKESSNLEERLARAKQAEVLEEQLAAARAGKRDAEARLAQVEEKALELDKQLDVAHAGKRNSEAQLQLASERHAEELEAQRAEHRASSNLEELVAELEVQLETERNAKILFEARLAKAEQQARDNAADLEEKLESQEDFKSSLEAQVAEAQKVAKEFEEQLEMSFVAQEQSKAKVSETEELVKVLDNKLAMNATSNRNAEDLLAKSEQAAEQLEEELKCERHSKAQDEAKREHMVLELQAELATALSQRRAALQASERAHLARCKQQQELHESQALEVRLRGELSESLPSTREADELSLLAGRVHMFEEEAAVAQQIAEAEIVRNQVLSGEISDAKLQQSHIAGIRYAAPEVALARAEGHAQIETFCAQEWHEKLEAAEAEVALLRSETCSTLQAVELREELRGVAQGTTQVLAGFLEDTFRGAVGGTSSPSNSIAPSDFKTPLRRTQLGTHASGLAVPALPLSAGGASALSAVPASPAASTSASAGSRSVDRRAWALPWGPPPTVARDLAFPALPTTSAATLEDAFSTQPAEGSERHRVDRGAFTLTH